MRIRYTQSPFRRTEMHKLKDRNLNYTASVSLAELPAEGQAVLRAYGQRHAFRCFDHTEGSFYLVPDWAILREDLTPAESLDQAACAGALGEYPYPDWRQAGFDDLAEYIRYLKALRFVASSVPSDALARHKLALYVTQ